MNSGMFLSFSSLSMLSPAAQAELLNFVKAQIKSKDAEAMDVNASSDDHDEKPADLSVAQVRKFLERVSDKVQTTLRMIAEAEPAGFDIADACKAIGVEEGGDLRGIWGGITKRVRTVLGDAKANLIWWTWQEERWVGKVSSMTHRSLRKALSLE